MGEEKTAVCSNIPDGLGVTVPCQHIGSALHREGTHLTPRWHPCKHDSKFFSVWRAHSGTNINKDYNEMNWKDCSSCKIILRSWMAFSTNCQLPSGALSVERCKQDDCKLVLVRGLLYVPHRPSTLNSCFMAMVKKKRNYSWAIACWVAWPAANSSVTWAFHSACMHRVNLVLGTE